MQASYLSSTSNPRLRSFLSPAQRAGHRSLSTTDTPKYLSKEYFRSDAHRIRQEPKTTQKIKLDDYRKPMATFMKAGNKLTKCSTKAKWDQTPIFHREDRQEQNKKYAGEGEELHLLIRQLKSRATVLQAQNNELRKKQQSDLQIIHKQNETINTLREVLTNQTQIHKKYLQQHWSSEDGLEMQKNKDLLNCTLCSAKEADHYGVHEIAFLKMKEERNELREEYRSLMVKHEEQKHELQKLRDKIAGEEKRINPVLRQLMIERNRELDEIDALLFSPQF